MNLTQAKSIGRKRRGQGRSAGATLVFAGEKEVPLLGVTVLESAGFWVDPVRQRLIRRPPLRNRQR